jgi:tungstate transport system ATP-binding protein
MLSGSNGFGTSILPLTLSEVCYDAGGKRLIDRLCARIEAGPRTIILGPNGAGKSLTLRLCHGLLKPSSGRISWTPSVNGDAYLYQAMVFQRPILLRRSARANLEYALRLRDAGRGERRAKAMEALERVRLGPLAERPARTLSVGEQQRLALARAWVLRPQVLFLDEPTASLDPAATRAVEEIINLFRLAGTKIVMTTHDLGQARRLADEVTFLHHGRLVEQSCAEEFFERPRSREAQAFIRGELLC